MIEIKSFPALLEILKNGTHKFVQHNRQALSYEDDTDRVVFAWLKTERSDTDPLVETYDINITSYGHGSVIVLIRGVLSRYYHIEDDIESYSYSSTVKVQGTDRRNSAYISETAGMNFGKAEGLQSLLQEILHLF